MCRYSSTHDVKKAGAGRSSGRPLFVSLAASLIHQPSPILRKERPRVREAKEPTRMGQTANNATMSPLRNVLACSADSVFASRASCIRTRPASTSSSLPTMREYFSRGRAPRRSCASTFLSQPKSRSGASVCAINRTFSTPLATETEFRLSSARSTNASTPSGVTWVAAAALLLSAPLSETTRR